VVVSVDVEVAIVAHMRDLMCMGAVGRVRVRVRCVSFTHEIFFQGLGCGRGYDVMPVSHQGGESWVLVGEEGVEKCLICGIGDGWMEGG